MPQRLVVLSMLAMGCTEPKLNPDAHHWEVTVSGFLDNCNPEPVASKEAMTYSLTFEASAVDLSIGWDTFATGVLQGCAIEYQSPLIGEERANGVVQWEMEGEAYHRLGGDACQMGDRVDNFYNEFAGEGLDFETDWNARSGGGLAADEVDWVGIETFRIIADEAEELTPGCTYTSLVVGTYESGP